MRFRDQRTTYYKPFGAPTFSEATPRMISAYSRGILRPGLTPDLIPQRLANRADRRRSLKGRDRVPGVALTPEQMPWKQS